MIKNSILQKLFLQRTQQRYATNQAFPHFLIYLTQSNFRNMTKLFFYTLFFIACTTSAQTIKSKSLKIKYTLANGWTGEEFGGKTSWDESGNNLCKCSGAAFYKTGKNGKLNVVIYPSNVNGLDSIKRNFVGSLRFEPVEKYDKVRNQFFSFEKRKSNFTETKSNKKSFEVIKLKTKVEDRFYIIYAWQESSAAIDPNVEKELNEMINAIEPL